MDWPTIITVASVLVGSGGIGAFLNKRVPAHTRMSDIVTELQEDRTRADSRIESLETKLDSLHRSNRVREDYIADLRQHIADEKPPPPPPYPETML